MRAVPVESSSPDSRIVPTGTLVSYSAGPPPPTPPPSNTAARTRPSIQTLQTLQTLTQHAALISAAMTCVTALIWIIYVSFFLRSYRRQQLPPILIT